MDLHLFKLTQLEEEWHLRQNVLAEDELARMQRFATSLLQQKFKLTRSALRFTLAEYVKQAPESLEFHYNEWGKPFLKSPHSVQFNLAHSGDYCVIAVSAQNLIGVDIEKRMQTQQPHLDIAKRFFTRSEYEAISAATDPERLFFHIWTQKEAFLKAIGQGLSFGLDQFEVSTDLNFAAVHGIQDPEFSQRIWPSQSLDILPDYALVITQENFLALEKINLYNAAD